MSQTFLWIALLLLPLAANAFPSFFHPSPTDAADQDLSQTKIGSFKAFTFYASAAYCPASATLTWACGTNCEANPRFQPVASGGDGDGVQFWFVGYEPDLQTIIVAHQGTDPSEIMSLATDADILRTPLDASLFPGISTSVTVHAGFADAQSSTATQILAAVESTAARFGATHVTLVGHSLGAAIALLDSVYLPLHLPNMTFSTVGYGLPRVGNQAFADYVDAHVTSFTRVNNKHDFVPIIPGRFLGFHHPSGEVHIQDTETWTPCEGQDNTAAQCIVGAVTDVIFGSVGDHSGPYDGVTIGC